MQNPRRALLAASCIERTIWGMRTQIRFAWFNAASAPLVVLAWCTIVVHAVLMITLTWRWAFENESVTLFGAALLSALMLGFVGATPTIVRSLGRPAKSRAASDDDQHDALLLFPSEDSGTPEEEFAADTVILAPRLLATRRKALL